MDKILDFLRRLDKHNEREWFEAHKAEYREVKAEFDAFAAQLIAAIASFEPSVANLSVNECTYRIYRDTRFSNDKTPYMTHMGAFIAPSGKKSGFAGYYFQVGAHETGYPGGCMLATGHYCCDSKVLRLLREDIAFDEGKEFAASLQAAPSFTLDWSDALKRVPAGFPADEEFSQWLRLRNFCLVMEPGSEYMTKPNLLERLAAEFKQTKPFLDFINRAIAYSRESNE